MYSSISRPNHPSSSVVEPENERDSREEETEILPNWLELPQDIWLKILSLLRTLDIVQHVEQVCMLFSELCHHPSLFKVIDMYISSGRSYQPLARHYNSITCVAVDRSAHKLVDVYLDRHCTEDTLMFVVERSKNLKHLRLRNVEENIPPRVLVKAIQNLPKLEELQLIVSSLPSHEIEVIGHSCPWLTSFSLSRPRSPWYVKERDAVSIAKCMPHLRNLQLLGSNITDEGLEAILDGCPHLEFLDLRGCNSLLNLSGPLWTRCTERINYLRSPVSSTNYYSIVSMEKEGTPYYEWSILPAVASPTVAPAVTFYDLGYNYSRRSVYDADFFYSDHEDGYPEYGYD